MKQLHAALIATGLILAFSVFFTSCENEPSEVGIGLQPGSDKIIVATDSLAVFTKTVRDSSITTDERSVNLLGSHQDDIFGLTNASFISQITLSSGNVSSDAVIIPDSMEIILDYAGYFGDTTQEITFNLYQIDNLLTPFDLDSSYYSDFDPDTEILEKTLLGQYTFTPEPGSESVSFIIDDENFLNTFTDNNLYVNDTIFQNNFYGFYFEALSTSTEGCIAYFNMKSEDSKMIMHYNNTATYEFLINSKCVRFNLFDHDYSTASADLQNTIANPETNNELAYIQSSAGLKVELRIEDTDKINDLLDKGINRAQLQITISTESQDTAATPEQLTLVYKNDNDLFEFLTDYKVRSDHFGGEFNSEDNTFTFNIPLYLQDIISGDVKLENYLSLFSLDNRTSANNCILYGGAHPEHPMQIKIITSDY